MRASLRRLRAVAMRLRLPWFDVALALVLAIAGLIWVTQAHQQDYSRSSSSKVVVEVPAVPEPAVPQVPRAALSPRTDQVFPNAYSYLLQSDNETSTAIWLNLLAALPLAVRRRWPYVAFVIGLGAVFGLHDGLVWPGFLAVMVLAYSVVTHGRYLWGSLVLLATSATIAANVFSNSIPDMPGWFSPFAVLVPVGLGATAIRSARAKAAASARRAEALEHERDAVARAAIAEERARIARELHDVVSHHVSVMVIQAGAAGKVIDGRPDLAADALRAIESSGREAMGELRHLLGLVAPLDDQLHPQPALEDLDALVDSVRAAGQPVTIRNYAGDVPRGLNLTAYRVVQEGLTNAMRYAPGAETIVELRRDGDDLVVQVRNDRPVHSVPIARMGSGSGLVGLAERVRLHEGTLEQGKTIDGGFRVSARIPLPAPVDVG